MNDIFLKSDELRRALNEHPELPLLVCCDQELFVDDYNWSPATGMSVSVGDVFDSGDCPYCPMDFPTFTERDVWKEQMEMMLEDDQRLTDAEWNDFCAERGEIWELCQTLWKPAIIICFS